MRHCNSVFKAQDIWFLLDDNNKIKRKLYLASCPVCEKQIALYSYYDEVNKTFYEKYYYSNGAKKIKERFKKEVTSTMLGFKTKYKAPSGFKYGVNKEIKRNGVVVELRQYAHDFCGNYVLVKKIKNEKS